MKKIGVIFSLFLLSISSVFSQNVGINTLIPDASSGLHVDFQDKGLLTPRMTTAQRNAILNPANGLLVFDTDENCFYFRDNAQNLWINMCEEGGGVDSLSFIKTEPLQFTP